MALSATTTSPEAGTVKVTARFTASASVGTFPAAVLISWTVGAWRWLPMIWPGQMRSPAAACWAPVPKVRRLATVAPAVN